MALATGVSEICVDIAHRERLGLDELVDLLRRRYPALSDELSQEATQWDWPTAVALNGTSVEWDRMSDIELRDGDEVYFFKLVAGG